MIMSFPEKGSMDDIWAKAPTSKEVAIENTKYIISEWISDNAYYRKFIRYNIQNYGEITSTIKKNAIDEKKLMKSIMPSKKKLSM